MKRVFLIALAVLTLVFVSFILSRMPFPESKSRDAIGTLAIATVNHNHGSNPPVDWKYYVSGEGKPIILIPSSGRPASDFNELASALNSARYKTIAFHNNIGPGFNTFSGFPDGIELAIPPLFLALQQEYDENIPNPVLIGHAFGNRLARAQASILPNSVDAVILLAAGGENDIQPKAEQALKNAFNPLLSPRKRRADIAYAFFADGNEVPTYWMKGWNADLARQQGELKNSALRDGGSWDHAGGVPMLVIQPTQDRIAPKEDAADVLLARYPDQVEVVVIKNAGHALLPEQPEAVADAVIEFLDRISGGD